MPSYFPEGDEPSAQDRIERSLQKINNLLNTAAASAPSTASAPTLTWVSGQSAVTGSYQVLGTLAGGSPLARRATVKADDANTGTISLVPTDANSVRLLGAGQEYLIEVPSGYKFSLDGWKVKSTVSGDVVSVQWCQ